MPVDLLHHGGDGTTTANRDAQVMHGIGICRFLDTSKFLENTYHSRLDYW
jgi:hypothetical protein